MEYAHARSPIADAVRDLVLTTVVCLYTEEKECTEVYCTRARLLLVALMLGSALGGPWIGTWRLLWVWSSALLPGACPQRLESRLCYARRHVTMGFGLLLSGVRCVAIWEISQILGGGQVCHGLLE